MTYNEHQEENAYGKHTPGSASAKQPVCPEGKSLYNSVGQGQGQHRASAWGSNGESGDGKRRWVEAEEQEGRGLLTPKPPL